MKQLKVRLTLLDEMLGTASSDPEIHDTFIASNAPDAMTREEEIAALGVEEVAKKGMTIFPKDENGDPFVWAYQMLGFFKESCKGLRRVSTSQSAKVKNYKQVIDNNIRVYGLDWSKKIPIHRSGEIGNCQRPLRAQTAQGERVALASSETVPTGSWLEFIIVTQVDSDMNAVKEWLANGINKGLGQWRNSGKGQFRTEIYNEAGKPVRIEKALGRKALEDAGILYELLEIA